MVVLLVGMTPTSLCVVIHGAVKGSVMGMVVLIVVNVVVEARNSRGADGDLQLSHTPKLLSAEFTTFGEA